MSHARAAATSSIPSWGLLPVAALILLAPNGMNRVGLIGHLFDGPAMAMRVLERARPYLGTRVAAKCIAPDGAITYIDPQDDCAAGTQRTDVFVLPAQNVGEGLTPGERASVLQTEIGSAAAAQQCIGLADLLHVIDSEAQLPGPAARLEELLTMRGKAVAAQQRLLCG